MYNCYIDTKEGIQVIQVAFYGWRAYALRMWNNQSFWASIAGNKSQGFQANGEEKELQVNATLRMHYRLVQFVSTFFPKVYFHFILQTKISDTFN